MDKVDINDIKVSDNNIGMWSVFESNVQTYRANMISSQAFLLAAGAVFVKESFELEVACVILALMQLWYIWFRIIRCRTIIVDFYRYNLNEKFNNVGEKKRPFDNPLESEIYLKNRVIRKKVNECIFKSGRRVKWTRIKLDIIMPISFSVMWVLMLAVSMISRLIDC